MEGLAALVRTVARRYSQLARCLDEYRKVAESDIGIPYRKQALLTKIRLLADNLPAPSVREQVLSWCQEEGTAVEHEKEEFRFHFTKEILASLSGLGMEVRGQIPLLRVGFFTVKIDLQKGIGVIYWGPEVERLKEKVSLVPAELTNALQFCRERLQTGTKMAPTEFLKLLHSAYRRCVLWAGVPVGTRVSLTGVLKELVMMMQPPAFQINPVRESFWEYPRVQFSYDIFRLRQAGSVEVDGTRLRLHVATFDDTTEKISALWVPDNERGEGTNYSHLSFVPVGIPDGSLSERTD